MATIRKTTKQDYRLGRRIQKIRKEKGLTQEKLAEKVGVYQTHSSLQLLGRD